MRAERDRRALILTAEGTKQSAILDGRGRPAGRDPRAPRVTSRPPCCAHRARPRPSRPSSARSTLGNPDDKLLAYQYLQTLPKIADSASSKLWIIPSEFTEALKGMSSGVRRLRRRHVGPREPATRRRCRARRGIRAAGVVTHPWFEGATRRLASSRTAGCVTAEDAAHGVAENSFAAVAAAHAAGAPYVESDCHLTADGVGRALPRRRPLARDRRPAPGRRRDGDASSRRSWRRAAASSPSRRPSTPSPTVRFNLDVKATDAASDGRAASSRRTRDRVLLTSFSDERRRAALAAAEHAGPRHPARDLSGHARRSRGVLAAVSVRSRPPRAAAPWPASTRCRCPSGRAGCGSSRRA